MKTNVTLIGMPGAGKSTIGIILAKFFTFGFIDTDVLIQINRQKMLQQIIDESGYLALREIEQEELLKINVDHHVIATGGSAVYSAKAMKHLRNISCTVFLKADCDILLSRIHNLDKRGIARAASQSFEDIYSERQVLYEKNADITVDCNRPGQEEVAGIIADRLRSLTGWGR
jgi:shikimate kinase